MSSLLVEGMGAESIVETSTTQVVSMTGRYPYQPAPAGQSSKLSGKALIAGGIGAFFLMIASCGVGTAIGGRDSTQATPTVTSTMTLTETATAASNETVWRTTTVTAAAPETATAPETTTTQVADNADNTPRGLVGTPTTAAPTADSNSGGSNSGGGSGYYANCSAARAAGAAPLYAGQPGYSSKLDRDGDGVACE